MAQNRELFRGELILSFKKSINSQGQKWAKSVMVKTSKIVRAHPNYSECLKYCNSLDATLPAYNEKSLIQKFILDVKYGSEFMHRFTDP